MDVEKLQRLAGSVRTGGKGTMRRYVFAQFTRSQKMRPAEGVGEGFRSGAAEGRQGMRDFFLFFFPRLNPAPENGVCRA